MLERIKPIPGLVNEILDHFPPETWTDPTKTFCDPALGGGQFVREIENRLRDAGHSDKNISSRVFGYEYSLALIDLAINMSTKQKLVGTYKKLSYNEFLTQETDMKFDVIVGNPPYQSNHDKDASSSRKVGNKLWYQFIFKADTLIKPNGYVAMVSPNQWLSGGVNMRKNELGVLKDIFAKKQLIVATIDGISEKYFKGIGISIGWWVYQNTKIKKETKINLKSSSVEIDFTDLEFLTPEATSESISIVKKTLLEKNNKFKTYYFNSHCSPNAYNESEDKTKINLYPHWIMGSDISNNLTIRYFPKVMNTRVNYKKIVFPMSTRYWQPYLADADISVTSLGQALKVEDSTTFNGFKSVFYSKLFKYLCFNLQIAQNGFMKTVLVRALPKVDLTRAWTDAELYAHFNLTQEEIDYIEANVK